MTASDVRDRKAAEKYATVERSDFSEVYINGDKEEAFLAGIRHARSEQEAQDYDLAGVLKYLKGATEAVLEANESEIECRMDEDCDHCVVLDALKDAAEALAALKPQRPMAQVDNREVW
jgi:hypothetical protein